MKKRALTLLLALVMCLSLCTPALAASPSVQNELNDPYFTTSIVSDASASELFETYARELAFVETCSNRTIVKFTRENIDIIKYIAAINHKNSAYNFSAMMTALALACAEARAYSNDLYSSSGTSSAGVAVLASNSILGGMHLRDVAVGATTTTGYSATFSMEVGSEVLGITLGGSFSQEFSYSVAGPSEGQVLNNGAQVTHRTAFAALYGTIIKENGRNYIDPDTAVVINYTILASIGTPTYCGQARGDGTFYFDNPYMYRKTIADFPSPFI